MGSDSLFSLDGKVVFVSGASSGIGLHLAEVLARAGAAVALAARRKDKLDGAVADLLAKGHRAYAVPMDVVDASTIAPAFDAAEQALGGCVDVLLNNAG